MANNAAPVHEHDCEFCTFLASYPLKFPYVDDRDGYRTGTPYKVVTMGDVYLNCETKPFTKYIVRYGIQGEYATTNTVSRYLLAPMVDGIDPYA